MSAGLDIRTHSDVPQTLEALRPHWSALLERAPTNTVFQSLDWYQSWWSAFGLDRESLLVVAYEDGLPVGVAPFAIRTMRRDTRLAHVIGDLNADYGDLIYPTERTDVLGALLQGLSQGAQRWDSLSLRNLPVTSPTVGALTQHFRESSAWIMQAHTAPCPALRVRGREAEVEATYHKYSLRRPENFYRRRGALRVENLTDIDEAERWLGCFFDQHIKRWAGTPTPSLFRDPRNRRLYQALTRRLLPSGQLQFTLARFNGHPISFHYGFDYNDRLLWYKPSFDIDFARHSPGLLLIHHLIGFALEHRRELLDLSIGDEPFKARFATETRHNVDLMVYQQPRRFITHSVFRQARHTARHAVQRLRH